MIAWEMTDRKLIGEILPWWTWTAFEMKDHDTMCVVWLPEDTYVVISFDKRFPCDLVFLNRPCPEWADDPGLSNIVQERFLRRGVSYDKREQRLSVELFTVDIDTRLMTGVQLVLAWFENRLDRLKDGTDFNPHRTSLGEAASFYTWRPRRCTHT